MKNDPLGTSYLEIGRKLFPFSRLWPQLPADFGRILPTLPEAAGTRFTHQNVAETSPYTIPWLKMS